MMLHMPQRIVRIHTDKTPHRIHHIPEWAEKRGLSQADIVRAMDVDKGLVSRWFKGIIPTQKYLFQLAEVFSLDDPAQLFRHPDDDWIARFFAERSDEERQRMIHTLEAAFPRKNTG